MMMNDEPINHGKPWKRDESILAFDLYCRIPFQKTKASNSEVRKLAMLLERSPGSIARKLGNFGAFDPELKRRNIVGLAHTSALDEEIWHEFHNDWGTLVSNADAIRRTFTETRFDPSTSPPSGPSEIVALRKQRLHQEFFRQSVLSSYLATCCVTGITVTECLIASHIVPWSVDERYRADPTNGLCLSATFDRLFDAGLITISTDHEIVVSQSLIGIESGPNRECIVAFDAQPIRLPHRFVPSPSHLEWHRENVFRG